jgi:hypothetical protein
MPDLPSGAPGVSPDSWSRIAGQSPFGHGIRSALRFNDSPRISLPRFSFPRTTYSLAEQFPI